MEQTSNQMAQLAIKALEDNRMKIKEVFVCRIV